MPRWFVPTVVTSLVVVVVAVVAILVAVIAGSAAEAERQAEAAAQAQAAAEAAAEAEKERLAQIPNAARACEIPSKYVSRGGRALDVTVSLETEVWVQQVDCVLEKLKAPSHVKNASESMRVGDPAESVRWGDYTLTFEAPTWLELRYSIELDD